MGTSGNKAKLEKLKAIAEKHITHIEKVIKRYEDWLKRCKRCPESRKQKIREWIAKMKENVEGLKAVKAHYEKELEDIELSLKDRVFYSESIYHMSVYLLYFTKVFDH